MRKTITVLVCAILVCIAGAANAMATPTTNAYVATVLGSNAYTIQNGGTQLYFHPQPDSTGVWYANDGTVLTYPYGGQTYNRDGMKTFAVSDVAYGQRLDSVKLEFDYYTGLDTTGYAMSSLTINILLTDGAGNYAMWSATSGGTAFTTSDVAGETGWKHLVLDMRSLANSTWGKMNEFNGGTIAQPYWNDIRDWTIAGFYDYLQYPQGGFSAYDSTLWGTMSNIGEVVSANQFGIALVWGDTVGGLYEDGNGEIGSSANRPYGQAGRLVKDYTITVDDTTYDVIFVPEPATIAILGLGVLCLVRKRK